MSTQLERFRDHCRTMAEAEHKPECPSLPENAPPWPTWIPIVEGGQITSMRWAGPPPRPPHCDGCNSPEDRAMFARLAAEVDEYQQGALL